jgi:hypothetical protein
VAVMKIKERKRLIRYIDKRYYKNNQWLYITSIEEWDGENCCVDIFDTDETSKYWGRYLFEVCNLRIFTDISLLQYRSVLRKYGIPDYVETFDATTASFTPFYFDRTFTLKKFEPLTKEDIENCAKYFIDKELDRKLLWNIKFITK